MSDTLDDNTIKVSQDTEKVIVSGGDRQSVNATEEVIQIECLSDRITASVDEIILTAEVVVDNTIVTGIEAEVLTVGLPGPEGSGSGGGGGTGIYVREFPDGNVDGTNRTFTLSHTPITNSLLVFLNGIMQVVGTSLTVRTVLFDADNVPQPGDSVYAYYQR